MKKIYCVLLLLPLLLFAGCANDTPQPTGGADENDAFIGNAKSFSLAAETAKLTSHDVTLKIMTPDGQIISRQGFHKRKGGVSDFKLGNGLKDGTYRLLYIEYPIEDNPDLAHLAEKFPTAQYGLGCRVSVSGNSITVCDGFDNDIGLTGSGTKDDPYIISCYSNLISLMKYVNNSETNKKVTKQTYFKQTNSIDMEQASFECDIRYGWLPIGADTNTPFRGVYQGDEISWLWIDRPTSSGVGLFGYVYNATFDGVEMSHADIKGNFAVGTLAGAAIPAGDDHGQTTFTNCSTTQSTIAGSSQSWAVGGLLGAVDMYSSVLIQKCVSDGDKISGSYNVGGLVGGCGLYSLLTVGDCTNNSRISVEYSGAGGLIGTADTLYVTGCTNSGTVYGATAYSNSGKRESGIGAGGICGGSGASWLSACTNSGEIKGAEGVGGIIGSTRIKGSSSEAYMFNNTVLRWCKNSGTVSGTVCVGGMCGEAQFGSYGVYNSGNITGGDYTAGIVGNTSIAVAHNAVNTGTVTGASYCSGIVGKTTWGSIALDHNYGKINGSGSHTAGILGLAGNNTIIHYCGNFGSVAASGSGPAGGIVAEIGDPRKWTAMNIAECTVGALEIGMAFLGPAIAVAETAVEAVSEGVAVALKIFEIGADAILTTTDTGLASYGLYEILNPEEEEELQNSLHLVVDNVSSDIKNEIETVRDNFSDFNINHFDKEHLRTNYHTNLKSTLNYYETEGNDEIFNESINKRREERMEELEKAHKTSEIIHEVVSGVAIAVSTVAIIGGAVASGGAAVPFIVAGSLAAVAGGLNAITKSTMDFERNAVVISQCLNAGNVSGSTAGGIVGVLQDNSIVTDCLNSADIKYPLVCNAKSKTHVEYCLVLNQADPDNIRGGCKEVVYYSPENYTSLTYYELSESGKLAMKAEDIGKKESYKQSGWANDPGGLAQIYWSINWNIGGSNNKWNIGSGSGNIFPVPCYSEMRK